MKLYELTEKFENAFSEMVDPETGELNENALATLDSLSTDINSKGMAVAAYIRNHDADVEAIRAEEQRLALRRKQLESRMEWLRGYLLENMVRCGISEIKSPYFTVRTKKCPPCVTIVNEADIPQKYIRVKEQISVDRNAVRQDISNGVEVPGCRMEQNTTIVIK